MVTNHLMLIVILRDIGFGRKKLLKERVLIGRFYGKAGYKDSAFFIEPFKQY
jgi:hypothetical protein